MRFVTSPASNAEGIAGGVGEQCPPTKNKRRGVSAHWQIAAPATRIARQGNSGRTQTECTQSGSPDLLLEICAIPSPVRRRKVTHKNMLLSDTGFCMQNVADGPCQCRKCPSICAAIDLDLYIG